jgi:hypothetical protein
MDLPRPLRAYFSQNKPPAAQAPACLRPTAPVAWRPLHVHSHTFGFCGVKRFKDTFDILQLDARPVLGVECGQGRERNSLMRFAALGTPAGEIAPVESVELGAEVRGGRFRRTPRRRTAGNINGKNKHLEGHVRGGYGGPDYPNWPRCCFIAERRKFVHAPRPYCFFANGTVKLSMASFSTFSFTFTLPRTVSKRNQRRSGVDADMVAGR